jgi:hypothetical protein
MLNPMMTVVADMVPDNVGIWLFHCRMPGHFTAGMRTRFHVLPRLFLVGDLENWAAKSLLIGCPLKRKQR